MARGAQLFDTCVPCHGPDGGGNQLLKVPSIAGLSSWYLAEQLNKFKNGQRGFHPDDTEGLKMRPMARTLYQEGDVESVVEYLASLPAVDQPMTIQGGDAAAGQAKYAVCVACHGADGAGNEGLHAPKLTDKADWYLLIQLEKYSSGMRGAHPDDAFGQTMRAISTTLANEQDRLDVLTYIQGLK